MRQILIAGAGSYIGTSVERWLKQPQFQGRYQVDIVDMRDGGWRNRDFAKYDAVFHVAGIAHVDLWRVTEAEKKQYYSVNCDLAAETAEKAKREGVRQFIYMSSIIVYGEENSLKKRVITKDTRPAPSNFYGDSKWKAEQRLMEVADQEFHVAILRPPMIYGEGSKGNYQTIKRIALRVPVFPDFPNQRSMLRIDLLCEYVRKLIDDSAQGLFFPQNPEYVKTSDLVRQLAADNGRTIFLVKGLNWSIRLASHVPGRIGRMVNKAFGSLIYERQAP